MKTIYKLRHILSSLAAALMLCTICGASYAAVPIYRIGVQTDEEIQPEAQAVSEPVITDADGSVVTEQVQQVTINIDGQSYSAAEAVEASADDDGYDDDEIEDESAFAQLPAEQEQTPDLIGFLIDDVTYVPVRGFFEMMGDVSASWDAADETAYFNTDELSVEVYADKPYMWANGRYFYTGLPYLEDGSLLVPLRTMAELFSQYIYWDENEGYIDLYATSEHFQSADEKYTQDEVYWLSRIISSESGNQPLLGKIAVGNVVLNRVRSSKFPNTIYGVIFERNQFTPAMSGRVYNEPTKESVIAAKICLEGYTVSDNILYFTSSKSNSSWMVRTRTLVTTIGAHRFFA